MASGSPPSLLQGMRAEPVLLQNASYMDTITSAWRAGVQDVVSYLPTGVARSMAGAYSAGAKARVIYARFDMANIRVRGTVEQPRKSLCLCLGYEDGYQIWDVHDTNNIQELISVRGAPTRCVKLLSHPGSSDEKDPHAETRPHFVAITREVSSQQPFVVKVVSLKEHRLVHTQHYRSEVSVESNARVMVLASIDNIAVHDIRTYSQLFTMGACHPNPHHPTTAFALGERWLAFATAQPVPSSPVAAMAARASRDPAPPIAHAIASVAKDVAWDLAAGLYKMGDRGLQAFSNYLAPDATGAAAGGAGGRDGIVAANNTVQTQTTTTTTAATAATVSGATGVNVGGTVTAAGATAPGAPLLPAGVVMIKDVALRESQAIIAHFQAHSAPIAFVAFNPAGSILATASETGQEIHVHQIIPYMDGRTNGGQPCAKLIYKLVRGITNAVIENIAFNLSSRWVCVTSARGTTHIFPINSTGGPISAASHANRSMSRYALPLDDGSAVTVNAFAKLRHVINYPELEDARSLPVTSHFYMGDAEEDEEDRKHVAALPQDAVAQNGPRGAATGVSQPQQTLGTTSWGPTQRIMTFSPTGLLHYSLLRPHAVHVPGAERDELRVEAVPLIEWNTLRMSGTREVRTPLEVGTLHPGLIPSSSFPSSSSSSAPNNTTRWLAHVEINTHTPPDRPLWQGTQFVFKTISSPTADAFAATELEVPSIQPPPIAATYARDRPPDLMARDLRAALADDAYVPIASVGRGEFSSSSSSPESLRHGTAADLTTNTTMNVTAGGGVTEDEDFDDAFVVSADVPADAHGQGEQQWSAAIPAVLDDLQRAWATIKTTALEGVANTAAAAGAAAAARASLYSLPTEADEHADAAAAAAQRESHVVQDVFEGVEDMDPPSLTMWSPDGDNELGQPGDSFHRADGRRNRRY